MKEFTVNGRNYISVATRGFYEPEDTYKMAENDHTLIIYRNDSMAAWENLPAGNYEIIGLVKDLSWDKRCAIRNIPNTYYDQSVIGRDMVEFDITHYDKEKEDWELFKAKHNLSDNDLILERK